MILPGRGLNEGDRVILSYVPKPVRGMQVEITEKPVTSPATRSAGRPVDGL